MEKLDKFDALIEVMNQLREGCPWDKKQTFDSLKSNTIEECYELIDAINNKDFDNIEEELGDVLLHVVFYAKMGEELGKFNYNSVIERLNKKLIGRHPHVFGTTHVDGVDDVMRNWEQIKRSEGKKTVLGGVPTALPALIKAYRIQQKAAATGFDWQNQKDVWNKMNEELKEFEAEVSADNKEKMKQEFGDVLFTMVNCARSYGIDPEEALELSNRKFTSRFNYIEEGCNSNFDSLDLEQMEKLWCEAKELEKKR